MLNLKNNENDALFDEICKKKAKIKIKFQKMKSTFLDSIPWLKSHQSVYILERNKLVFQLIIFQALNRM